MKVALFLATYNKNNELPNTLWSIARQNPPFEFEICIFDDHSDVDPEPIVREFIPDAKYLRPNRQQGSTVANTYISTMPSPDVDILIRQSADVIHERPDTIEQLCKGVGPKKLCMAAVANTAPPLDMYKNFDKYLKATVESWKRSPHRSGPSGRVASYYFFLGAIRKADYESLDCTKEPHCDNMLSRELMKRKFEYHYPKGLRGFHQHHPKTTVPCTRLTTCNINCPLKKRCLAMGWKSFEDYLKWKENQKLS
jgi:glycosyltransferase involved in cell wall biosynthesis